MNEVTQWRGQRVGGLRLRRAMEGQSVGLQDLTPCKTGGDMHRPAVQLIGLRVNGAGGGGYLNVRVLDCTTHPGR